MKKTSVLSICLLFTVGAIAQQKAATTNKPVHHSAAKPSFSPEKLKMLCKPWKLDTIENFGVAKPATAAQQNDGITLLADSTLFLTMDGQANTGKWMRGWSDKVINTVTGTNSDIKKMFTIMKLSNDYLELEYQTPDLIRIHYFYSAKKQ
jgi:hypothetical protein